jgi:hypothetical protein
MISLRELQSAAEEKQSHRDATQSVLLSVLDRALKGKAVSTPSDIEITCFLAKDLV